MAPAVTQFFGIPVPSTNPLFLGLVGLHVAMGLLAVICGAIAMLSRKGRGWHFKFGTVYFWMLFGLFVTMSALSLMRWAGIWRQDTYCSNSFCAWEIPILAPDFMRFRAGPIKGLRTL